MDQRVNNKEDEVFQPLYSKEFSVILRLVEATEKRGLVLVKE